VLPKHIPPPPFLLQNVILKSNFHTKIAYDASKQHVFILRGKNGFGTIEEKTLHDSIRESNFCKFQSVHFHFNMPFWSQISKQNLCTVPLGHMFSYFGGEMILEPLRRKHCKHVHDSIRHYIFCEFQSLHFHFKISFSSQFSKQNLNTVPIRNMFSYFRGKMILEPLRKNTLQACTWLNKALHFLRISIFALPLQTVILKSNF
jgi:hypothetical protein